MSEATGIKAPRKKTEWDHHVEKFRHAHPHLKFKEVLIAAKETYHKKSGKGIEESPEMEEPVPILPPPVPEKKLKESKKK